MKKSKKFVLAALALLAITGLLALAGCKNDSVPPEVEKQEQGDGGGSETDKNNTAAKLVSISVTTPPVRTVYSVGQEFDPTGMVVTATYDDEEPKDVTSLATTDFDTVAGEKGLKKPVTVSYTEGETSKTTTFTVTVFPEEVKVLTGYTSPNNTDNNWTYVAFGEWPQSEAPGVNPTLVAPQPENLFKDKYYFDANGKYVEKDGQYYKVEPIVWRVLNKDYASTGKALLLAESILTGGVRYYVDLNTRTITGAGTKEGEPVTVYPNNWQYSTIRAWLNGRYEEKDSQPNTYTDKGFLQTAFTESAQTLIADTSVDNTAASTFGTGESTQENPYAYGKTKDKIFLLSQQEATESEYGFGAYSDSGKGNTRIRVTTDYAEATGAYQDSTGDYGGWWWLRSPDYLFEDDARGIHSDGYAYHIDDVNNTRGGVVPALSISLTEN